MEPVDEDLVAAIIHAAFPLQTEATVTLAPGIDVTVTVKLHRNGTWALGPLGYFDRPVEFEVEPEDPTA